VRARGQLACGVSTGVVGLSQADSRGEWRGIDADFCRAIAAAVLGDANRVRFVPTTPQNRFAALQPARWTCWRATRPGASAATWASA